ncbi:MAG: ATP-binding protein [Bacteroidota bacterium]
MKIYFNGDFKSLSTFATDNLTGLCIITGKNGSGKSQFVELFKDLISGRAQEYTFSLTPELHPNEIQIEGISVESNSRIDNASWKSRMQQAYQTFRTKKKRFALYAELQDAQVPIEQWPKQSVTAIFSDLNLWKEKIKTIFTGDKKALNDIENKGIEPFLKEILREYKYEWTDLLVCRQVASFKLKNIADLTSEDFTNAVIGKSISQSGLFVSTIDEIIYDYYKGRHDNLYNFFRKKEINAINNAVSDNDFLEQHENPVVKLNKIFDDLKIGYYIPELNLEDFSLDQGYSFFLKNKASGVFVGFNELSSGEKIIIGLILRVFFYSFFGNSLKHPRLLILDEPDAHLHPEMSKLLIDVLQKTFVEDLKITILMTTHSASTVAMAPDNPLWVLKNHPTTVLEKTTKDEALKLLTSNIPTLSIDYKNHRQIFVESPTDRQFYQAIFDKHFTGKIRKHNLYFISSPSGKSSCEQIKDIVSDLRLAGNNTCFCIVDWDKKNASTSAILVHGIGKRYSLENFLYDPLYLAILFLEQGCKNDIKEIGFNKYYSPFDIRQEPNERLQEIADWIINGLEAGTSTNVSTREVVHYYNDRSVSLPMWFLHQQGHSLYELISARFKSMEQFRDEKSFTAKMLEIAVRSYPLVSSDTIELMRALACGEPE